MGHLDQPLNTFWEIFFQPANSSSWALVTPRGVADNGGLVATSGLDRNVTVGFLPNQNLQFSPLARTSDNGTTWSPGVISNALVAAPDVLADSEGGDSYALVRSGGGRVLVAAPSDITTWRSLVTRLALGGVANDMSCHVGRLSALTVDSTGHPFIGTTCTKGNRIGIFGMRGGRWDLVGPHISGQIDSTTSTVLRLQMTGSTLSSLLAVDGSGHTSIRAARSGGTSGRWTMSQALPFDSSERIISTADNGAGGFLVQTAGPTGMTTLWAIAGQQSDWQRLNAPPMGTKAVVTGVDRSVEALSVRSSKLTVWELSPPSYVWRETQTIDVPIDYGSSN